MSGMSERSSLDFTEDDHHGTVVHRSCHTERDPNTGDYHYSMEVDITSPVSDNDQNTTTKPADVSLAPHQQLVHRHIDYYVNEDGELARVGSSTQLKEDADIVDVEEEQELIEERDKYDQSLYHRFWRYSIHVTHYHGLPDWLKDNEHLHSGHRLPIPDVAGCFRSVFSLHTETFNIWTHLLGCLTFMCITGWFLTHSETQWQEKLVFSAFFLSAIVCLGMSATFHMFCCHSPQFCKLFGKLDYIGIAVLIVGSTVPWVFYGFYCRAIPKIVYILMMCILGSGTVYISLSEEFSKPHYRPLRAVVFVLTGLSGVIPGVHYLITDGYKSLIEENALHWMALMGSLYILGATLYALRIPERWYPGKFDIWGHSHQIFHLFVIAAALVHYVGIQEMADKRLAMNYQCALPESY